MIRAGGGTRAFRLLVVGPGTGFRLLPLKAYIIMPPGPRHLLIADEIAASLLRRILQKAGAVTRATERSNRCGKPIEPTERRTSARLKETRPCRFYR